MPFCAVFGCNNKYELGCGKKFFKYPGIKTREGEKTYELSLRRRQLWIAVTHRQDLDERGFKYFRVCSDHFISGHPSYLHAENDPDWVPSLKLGLMTDVSQINNADSCSRKRRSLDSPLPNTYYVGTSAAHTPSKERKTDLHDFKHASSSLQTESPDLCSSTAGHTKISPDENGESNSTGTDSTMRLRLSVFPNEAYDTVIVPPDDIEIDKPYDEDYDAATVPSEDIKIEKPYDDAYDSLTVPSEDTKIEEPHDDAYGSLTVPPEDTKIEEPYSDAHGSLTVPSEDTKIEEPYDDTYGSLTVPSDDIKIEELSDENCSEALSNGYLDIHNNAVGNQPIKPVMLIKATDMKNLQTTQTNEINIDNQQIKPVMIVESSYMKNLKLKHRQIFYLHRQAFETGEKELGVKMAVEELESHTSGRQKTLNSTMDDLKNSYSSASGLNSKLIPVSSDDSIETTPSKPFESSIEADQGDADITFPCIVCRSVCTSYPRLLEHMEEHEDKNNLNYVCCFCGNHFNCAQNFSYHHFFVKCCPYVCDLCNIKFHIKSKLLHHKDVVHNIWPKHCMLKLQYKFYSDDVQHVDNTQNKQHKDCTNNLLNAQQKDYSHGVHHKGHAHDVKNKVETRNIMHKDNTQSMKHKSSTHSVEQKDHMGNEQNKDDTHNIRHKGRTHSGEPKDHMGDVQIDDTHNFRHKGRTHSGEPKDHMGDVQIDDTHNFRHKGRTNSGEHEDHTENVQIDDTHNIRHKGRTNSGEHEDHTENVQIDDTHNIRHKGRTHSGEHEDHTENVQIDDTHNVKHKDYTDNIEMKNDTPEKKKHEDITHNLQHKDHPKNNQHDSYTANISGLSLGEMNANIQAKCQKQLDSSDIDGEVKSKILARRQKLAEKRKKSKETKQGTHVCKICDVEFKTYKCLYNHLNEHETLKTYICEICGQGFVFQGQLNVHLQKHRMEKNHQCDTCGKTLKSKQGLNRHLQSHAKDTAADDS